MQIPTKEKSPYKINFVYGSLLYYNRVALWLDKKNAKNQSRFTASSKFQKQVEYVFVIVSMIPEPNMIQCGRQSKKGISNATPILKKKSIL